MLRKQETRARYQQSERVLRLDSAAANQGTMGLAYRDGQTSPLAESYLEGLKCLSTLYPHLRSSEVLRETWEAVLQAGSLT